MIKYTILSSAGAALLFLSSTFANPPSSSTSVAPSVENTSSCEFHSGFRAGIGLGYKNHSVQNKYEYVASAAIKTPGGGLEEAGENRQKTSIRQSAIYQAHMGYDWIKNNWLLSVELDYRYNPGVNKGRITSNDQFLSAVGAGDFVFAQSHRHDFGLGVRVGHLVSSRLSLYGIANLRLGQFHYKFVNEKTLLRELARGEKKQFRWGGGFGIGCQYALPQGFTFGPEITYDIYQPVKINRNLADPNIGTFFVQSSRPKIFNAVIKLSKTF